MAGKVVMLIIKKIILIFCSLLVSLILAELIIRITPSLRSKYQLSRYEVKKHSAVPCGIPKKEEARNKREGINKDYRKSGLYLYRPSKVPGLGYELIPYMPAEREVNSYGMVCKEYPIKKGPNVYRILVLGDSVTQEYSFVENLETMLNAAHLGLDFELWNAGTGGYQVNQYAAYLKYKGIRYEPDMVIVDFCLNDFDLDTIVYYETKNGVAGYRNTGYYLSKAIPLNKWCYRHSYLYRLLIINLEKLLFTHEGKNKDSAFDENQEGRYYLKSIMDICKKHKIPLLAVIFPYLKPLGEYTDGEKEQYKMISDSLRELDIDVIDLHAYIPEEIRHTFRSNKKVAQDIVHMKPEGYNFAARAVFSYLVKNYFEKTKIIKKVK